MRVGPSWPARAIVWLVKAVRPGQLHEVAPAVVQRHGKLCLGALKCARQCDVRVCACIERRMVLSFSCLACAALLRHGVNHCDMTAGCPGTLHGCILGAAPYGPRLPDSRNVAMEPHQHSPGARALKSSYTFLLTCDIRGCHQQGREQAEGVQEPHTVGAPHRCSGS